MTTGLSLPPLAGGLLVGGASRRFGRPKALEPLAGRTFAERIAEALAALTGEVVLLGGGEIPAALGGLPRCADAQGVRGPLAGVLAGLAARPDRAWLIAACDQPWLDGAALAWLVACRAPGRIAVLPRTTAERVEPFPGVYEPAARAVLERAARDGELSLQPFGRRPDVVTPRLPPALAAAWRDVDAPTDLEPPGAG